MTWVTQEDLDTAIVRTINGNEMKLVPYEYLAAMAGEITHPGNYDPEAVCMTCGEGRWSIMWRWYESINGTDGDTGNWECTKCILAAANSESCPDSWYILAR